MDKIKWLLVLVLLTFLFPLKVSAQQACQQQDPCISKSDFNEKTSCYASVVDACKSQGQTLSGQIDYLNNKIRLIGLQIANTKAVITKLSGEIGDLNDEITRLETVLTKRSELILRRIPESYKRASVPQFGLLFFSRDFSDFVARLKYLVSVEQEDAALIFQVKATQNNYSERKQIREEKKKEQEQAKNQLEEQNNDLTQQKRTKDSLLVQTKGQEAIYQQLLVQALAEKQALEGALLSSVSVGPVKKGDPIALVGNSGYPGCSTGPHLHFEVRKNNTWTDPAGYLSSKTVIDDQEGGTWTTGNGSWDWPLSDPIRITQRFGRTPYSWVYKYSGGIHTGYDMVSSASQVIRAPADGTLYSSSQACGTSVIKIKYIDHGGGIVSFYLHVQ